MARAFFTRQAFGSGALKIATWNVNSIRARLPREIKTVDEGFPRLEIDYVDEIIGASFAIRNPNATSSCGCGNSFSLG